MHQLKKTLITYCENYLLGKVTNLKQNLLEVTNAGNNETKSTAGDKHETGRAMMQLEQEKIGNQLLETEKQYNDFNKINFTNQSNFINLGSLVCTDKGVFFIATSIGKINIDGNIVFIISNKSPIALAFIGKYTNNVVSFNGINYTIKQLV